MASAIDSGVDTGNDSNDSCVQDRTSKMEVDQLQTNTSTSLVTNESSSSYDRKDTTQNIFKDLSVSVIMI